MVAASEGSDGRYTPQRDRNAILTTFGIFSWELCGDREETEAGESPGPFQDAGVLSSSCPFTRWPQDCGPFTLCTTTANATMAKEKNPKEWYAKRCGQRNGLAPILRHKKKLSVTSGDTAECRALDRGCERNGARFLAF